jgi:hypothetical protein
MNATATPAKVARIGASRPRVYEQLAGPVPAREKPVHFAVWLSCAICALFTGLSLWHLVANLLEASPR